MALPCEAFEDDAVNSTSRQFWNNELIWKEVKSYLSSCDLISLASTNKYFHFKITAGATEIKKLVIQDDDDFKLKTTSKVDFSNVSTLLIRNIGTLSEDIIIPGLIKVFSECRKLTYLMLGTHAFFDEKYAPLFKNKYVRQRLSQLQQLEIGPCRKRNEVKHFNSDNRENDDLATFNSLKRTQFVPTYNAFPYINMELESFYYQEPDSLFSVPTSYFQPEMILCNSMCSLRSLYLEINVDGFKKLEKIKFLRLEELELTIDLPVGNPSPTVSVNENLPNGDAIVNENEDRANENLPNGNAIVNENEDRANENLIINDEIAIADQEVAIDAGNADEESGSDHEEDFVNDRDENDSDEDSDYVVLSAIINDNLVPFLRNHLRTLKIVKMTVLNECWLKFFYETFQQSEKIELLSLSCVGEISNFLTAIDWSVLRRLSTLKAFKLKFEYEQEAVEEVYSYLGEEYRMYVDEDSLSEIEYNRAYEEAVGEIAGPKMNDWNLVLNSLPCGMERISLCEFEYTGIQEDISSVVISSIGRFENLRVLKMEKCPDFFNDDTLQFICKTLTKLSKLKGEFHKVTDFGISGLRENGSDSGVSLRNLKGLQKLVIYSGSGTELDNQLSFTWAGLLRSVAFLELTRLKIMGALKDVHLDGRKVDSKDGHNYLKLIQQNPSLVEIGLSFYTPINWFREQVTKLNPRITTIHLNVHRRTKY